jgi:hypothetical protein
MSFVGTSHRILTIPIVLLNTLVPFARCGLIGSEVRRQPLIVFSDLDSQSISSYFLCHIASRKQGIAWSFLL